MCLFLAQTMQSGECLFEAVEQQDLDTVQILLYQFSADELDLNTPNSQGLTPLDIAIMTNNTPIAKLLLKAGGKESPHCEYTSTVLDYFEYSAPSQREKWAMLLIRQCLCLLLLASLCLPNLDLNEPAIPLLLFTPTHTTLQAGGLCPTPKNPVSLLSVHVCVR